jgi:hypothetical protein
MVIGWNPSVPWHGQRSETIGRKRPAESPTSRSTFAGTGSIRYLVVLCNLTHLRKKADGYWTLRTVHERAEVAMLGTQPDIRGPEYEG